MASVEGFLRKNVQDVEKKEEVKFDRFSEPFVIRTVTETEAEIIRKDATKHTRTKSGMIQENIDSNKYVDGLILAAVVNPDLNNKSLQDDWGTPGQPQELLKRMLYMGEYSELGERVQKLGGFDLDSVEELSDSVKK